MFDLESQRAPAPIGDTEPYREYRPDARLADTHWTAMRHLWGEFVRYRSHVRTMFAQEFRNSYRGTRLGVFWNFFLPLLPISVYVLLASLRVLPSFEGVPGTLAIACNVTCWFLLVACIRTPIGIVQQRNAAAMKTSLPLSTAIAASFARVLFETMVRVGAVVAIAVALQEAPVATAVFAIPVLLAGCVLFLAAGLMLAIFNVVVPDVDRLVGVVLQYGIFLSGVIFPLAAAGRLSVLQQINPFAVFITAVRDLLFVGQAPHPMALFATLERCRS